MVHRPLIQNQEVADTVVTEMPPKSGFAPKCRTLTSNETPGSFENWKDTLIFNLTIDNSFEFLLDDEMKWRSGKVTNRGFTNDGNEVEDAAARKTAKQKAAILKMMLGTIAGFAPVISRKFITEEALSFNDIWTRLRIFYGFRKSGGLILDLTSFQLEEDESHESLWERVHAFAMDNLLQPADGLQHLGEDVDEIEELTPTLSNALVALWLHSIHKSLPALVKQRYSAELRSKTLMSVRIDISESLNSLLSELHGETAASIARASTYNNSRRSQYNQTRQPFYQQKQPFYQQKPSRFCAICDANKRQSDHFLSECPDLPDADRRFMKARTRTIGVEEEKYYDEDRTEQSSPVRKVSTDKKDKSITKVGKVTVKSSPFLNATHKGQPAKIVIDSGAQSNVMKLSYANKIGAKIYKTTSVATQADGVTDMNIAGEVHLTFDVDDQKLYFDGLVTEDLSDDILAGVPFMEANDCYARPSKRLVFLGDRAFKCDVINKSSRAEVVRVQSRTVVLPGDSINLKVSDKLSESKFIAIDPRTDAPSIRHSKYQHCWLQPQVVEVIEGHISVQNKSVQPVSVKKFEHIATARPIFEYSEPVGESQESVIQDLSEVKSVEVTKHVGDNEVVMIPDSGPVGESSDDHEKVVIDPDRRLSEDQQRQFQALHQKYSEVFDSSTLGLYNGASGPLKVVINMGPTLPPQRKGRMPVYNRSQLVEQQNLCDKLEGTVLLKPEDVGVTVEYLNTSFLVKKKSGDKRLVTAFGEVGEYAKPQPALMSDTNTVLRQIAEYEEVIISDLTSAYWQMELSRDSMKFCGIATPFKGVRVYGRGAMGMPGTETALEELMCRILGCLITSGQVTKLADDIYCGGSSVEEVLNTWEKVLAALKENGLKLSSAKTVVCPKSVMILGWIWEGGSLKASPHKISTLAAVEPPQTVGRMRSYVGGVKFLSRVLKQYSEVLHPLEEEIGGRKSNEKITWTEPLRLAFEKSQERLKDSETLTLPKRRDQIQIVTDASNSGIGSAMYVIRDGVPMVSGYYSACYKKHQSCWYPCEAEALSIHCAVNHFAPYIVESDNQTTVLTDSLPCVKAYGKLKKGQFSSSSRVTTFLSTLCRYNVHLIHLKGTDNIYADYASRNTASCEDKKCQICTYVQNTIESVVRSCTVRDVLESSTSVPFSSRAGWYELQLSDEALRRTCAHLKQGTRPSRKSNDVGEVKQYLQKARVDRDGLLVVQSFVPNIGRCSLIVVPRIYLHGLLECLHIKLEHPTKTELKKVMNRAFFALDLDAALDVVSKSCHRCVSLADMPNRFIKQSSTTSPTTVGSNFAADVFQRSGKDVLLLREYVSSYTTAKLIWNERATTLRTALIILMSDLMPSTGFSVTVKVDPASSCRSLKDDKELFRNGITLILGHAKMKNKNPVAEHGVRELHSEINKVMGDSPNVTEKILAKAVQNLNCRLRWSGASAREVWTKRNQYTGEQLPIDDVLLMKTQEQLKKKSHTPSALHKARGKQNCSIEPVSKGDLIYINSDRNKLHARERYVVVEVANDTCKVQKFAGSQLRARVYTIKRADVTKVMPWRFEDIEYLGDESEAEDDNNLADKTVRDEPARRDDDLHESTEDEEDKSSGSEEEINHEVTPENTEESEGEDDVEVPAQQITRSGRAVKVPRWQEGYVVRRE